MKHLNLVLILPAVSLTTISCNKNNFVSQREQLFLEGKKVLVVYFSATGTTQRIAERIAQLTQSDVYRIEPQNPYAANPYDDSDKIQQEAYQDLRPAVANLPDRETIAQYDVERWLKVLDLIK